MEPVVIHCSRDVASALQVLDECGQAVGFVSCTDGLVGVVTVEDLRFAWDWSGSAATVIDAMTFGLVEVDRGADARAATEAFSDGLRRWITARHRPCPTRAPWAGP